MLHSCTACKIQKKKAMHFIYIINLVMSSMDVLYVLVQKKAVTVNKYDPVKDRNLACDTTQGMLA